jgi:hypothetical protein
MNNNSRPGDEVIRQGVLERMHSEAVAALVQVEVNEAALQRLNLLPANDAQKANLEQDLITTRARKNALIQQLGVVNEFLNQIEKVGETSTNPENAN